MKTETIELIGGYTDKDGVTHKEITFGKRLTAQDLINIDTDPQVRTDAQYQDAIRRQMITKFGTLKTPTTFTVLSSLDSIDTDDLESAADGFLATTREHRAGDFLEKDRVKLVFGLQIGDVNYTVVEFGNRRLRTDDIEADILSLRGVARDCFLIGKQISKISNEDGTASIDGKVDLKSFYSLDAEDLQLLKVGAELFRQSFRFKRESVPAERDGGNGGDSSAGISLVGSGNSGDAAGTN